MVVDADTEDEAKKKVKAIIATGAVSPFYDKLNFDYETGVRGDFERKVDKGTEKEGVLRNLRAQLARAETSGIIGFKEQDQVLSNFVGSSGFTRNTKGQVALTPTGLEELGLPIQYRELSDGSKLPLNTIIDENDFGFKKMETTNRLTGPFENKPYVGAWIAKLFLLPPLFLIFYITSIIFSTKVLYIELIFYPKRLK